MKHNPDDRRDNVDKLQFMINHTIENMEKAEETMELTDDPARKRPSRRKTSAAGRLCEGSVMRSRTRLRPNKMDMNEI